MIETLVSSKSAFCERGLEPTKTISESLDVSAHNLVDRRKTRKGTQYLVFSKRH